MKPSPIAWMVGLLLAALVPTAIFAIGDGTALWWGIVFQITLAAVILLGLPVTMLFRRLNWMGPVAAAIVGCLIAVVVAGYVSSWFSGDLYDLTKWRHTLRLAAECGALGISGGLAFWLTFKLAGVRAR